MLSLRSRPTARSTRSSSAVNRADRVRVAVQELRLQHCGQMGPAYFHGETMRPFMGEGDLVIVEPVAWEDLRRGDIITYRFDDKFPTRRIVAIDRQHEILILRGDSIRGWPDFEVPRADVLGRACSIVRSGVRIDHHSRAWRRATRRALATERLVRLARACPRPVRRLLSRIATTLDLR